MTKYTRIISKYLHIPSKLMLLSAIDDSSRHMIFGKHVHKIEILSPDPYSCYYQQQYYVIKQDAL